jgi:hypothetical protein
MNRQTHFSRPVRSAMIGFLSLTAIVVAAALAKAAGLVEVAVEQRVFGLAIGAMIVVAGNFLPKMRPLNMNRGSPAKTTAAERVAGWVLSLAGLAYIALFVFAPLHQASHVSSIIGIGAIVLLAVDWTWWARNALFGGRQQLEDTPELSRRSAQKRKPALWLLTAFFYVLAIACVTFLFYDTPSGHQIGSWSIVVFASIYAVLYGFLGDKKGSCK